MKINAQIEALVRQQEQSSGDEDNADSNAEGAKIWGLETEIAAKITPVDRVQVTAAPVGAVAEGGGHTVVLLYSSFLLASPLLA